MADLAELNIKVNATAEGLESALETAAQGVRRFAKEVESASGKPVDIKVKTDSLNQASSAIRGLFDSVKTINGDVIRQAQDIAKAAGAETSAEIQSVIAAAQGGIQAMGDAGQKAGAQAEQGGKAVEQSAQQTQAALADMGASGQQAGEQVAQGGRKGADGLKKTTVAAKAADAALSGMGKLGLSVVQGIVGGITGGLTNRLVSMVLEPIEAWIDGLIHLREEQEKARKENVQTNLEAAKANLDMAASIREMAARYGELSQKRRSASEESEFLALQSDLAKALGTTTQAIDSQVKSLDTWMQTTESAARIQAGRSAEAFEKAANELLISAREKGKTAEASRISIDDWSVRLQKLAEGEAAYEGLYTTRLDALQARLAEKGVQMSDALKLVLGTAFQNAFTMDESTFLSTSQSGLRIDEYAELMVQQGISNIEALLKNPSFSDILEGYNGIAQKVMFGEMTPKDAVGQVREYGDQLLGMLVPMYEDLGQSTAEARASAAELMKQLVNSELVQSGDGLLAYLEGIAGGASKLDAVGSAFESLDEGAKSLTGNYKDLLKRFNDTTSQKKAVGDWKKLRKEYDALKKEGKSTEGIVSKLNKALKDAGSDASVTGKNLGELDKYMEGVGDAADSAGIQFVADVQGMISSLESYRAQLEAEAVMSGADNSQAIASINAVIAVLNALLTLAGQAGIELDSGKSGGGGGKRNEAEDAARAAEEARNEAIQRDYDMSDHKRHMNELTLEEELRMLEELRRNHQLNAEEIMEWEEKVYDLKKELRERDAESVDSLGDAVADALEARYEAMRDAEIDRLDASREAWEQWRDDSVKAIEDQIDALDKLSETEDREKKDQEELRKIAKLKQEVEFEQDDYNRAKLQQQLDKAVADRDERLRKLALEDQKDALREQIEQIEQKADSEIDALDKEQDEIEAAYDERMKEAALRAEAEKLLMTQTQQQLLSLLKEFAPDYDATGQTLGEKLLEGFRSRVGDIAKWFEAFNAQMARAQEQLASTAQAAADAFYREHSQRAEGRADASMPPVVNQTVNFYEPVETPSQVARRMEDVNDALGELLG